MAALSSLPQTVDAAPSCIDFDLEYLVAYGRHAGQLPAVKAPDLVDRLVDLYERAIAGAELPQT